MVSLEQWFEWGKEYNCLPYVARFHYPEGRPGNWEQFWKEAGKAAFVLESGKAGRYTFVSGEPAEWIVGGLAEAERVRKDSVAGERMAGAPLEVLRRWMAEFKAPRVETLPKFTGGIAGYLAYDIVRTLERLPECAAAEAVLPEYFFMRTEKLWMIDHDDHALFCAVFAVRPAEQPPWSEDDLREQHAAACREVQAMKRTWDRWMTAAGAGHGLELARDELDIDIEGLPELKLSLSKDQYKQAVEKIRDYIANGDVFQVNVSVRQEKPLKAAPERVYETLRQMNPSPYMAFLRLPAGQRIVSGSPELLIRREGRKLATRPIAGTRPRGANDGEDGLNRAELLLSEKERAEHIMLVDLERNDLGKISAYGTVEVKELMAVEHYSHVMHIVSEVEGELAAGKDTFDCIAAVFPGGTITGAPKVRTMEIIEELEPVRRSVYTGAIGWIDYNGNMELNITIRTLVYADGTAYVQAGAGIVIDSDPEKEFYESLNKAKALWKAVEISERIGDAANDSCH